MLALDSDLAGACQRWGAVEVGIRHTCDRVGHARAEGRQTDAGGAGEPARETRHEGGRLFMTHLNGCEQMLHGHRYGRLGFSLDGEVHIFPINYGYDGAHIYAHATPGTKVGGMRHNPSAALEIDEIDDPAH